MKIKLTFALFLIFLTKLTFAQNDTLDIEQILDAFIGYDKELTSKHLDEKIQEKIEQTKFISKKDSATLAKSAREESAYNPMFLDWVFSNDESEGQTFENITATLRKNAKNEIKASFPELYTFHVDQLPDLKELELQTKPLRPVSEFLFKQEIKNLPNNNLNKIVLQKSNWDIGGKISIQASQNYITKNWYTGGYGNLSIIGNSNVRANYDNKKNLKFENLLEWRFGFNSTTNDTLRLLNTNDDLLRLTSKVGLKALKNWYYTLSGEASTQLFNTFVPNTKELSTAPLSPVRFYLSLGMDYSYKKIVSVSLAPLSYKLTYVLNKKKADGVSQSVADKFNIPEGKSTLHNIGSRVQINAAYSFTKELRAETKMYIYTDYKNVEFDWEIIGNFIATRFFTVQLSLHPRFDSSFILEGEEKPRLQFREFVSLGFLYVF